MTSHVYNRKVADARDSYFKTHKNNDGSTDSLAKIILKTCNRLGNKAKILDLGTGNGYLANRIYAETTGRLQIIGIDISNAMIENAKQSSNININFQVMDNFNLQFPDEHFDIVMAKSVSKISISEMDRVLKKGGHFFYKEYSGGKGLVEVFDVIEASRPIGGFRIVEELYKLRYKTVCIEYLSVPIKRSKEQVVETVATMNIAPNESIRKRMLLATDKLFGSQDKPQTIHSDPFIIQAQK